MINSIYQLQLSGYEAWLFEFKLSCSTIWHGKKECSISYLRVCLKQGNCCHSLSFTSSLRLSITCCLPKHIHTGFQVTVRKPSEMRGACLRQPLPICHSWCWGNCEYNVPAMGTLWMSFTYMLFWLNLFNLRQSHVTKYHPARGIYTAVTSLMQLCSGVPQRLLKVLKHKVKVYQWPGMQGEICYFMFMVTLHSGSVTNEWDSGS